MQEAGNLFSRFFNYYINPYYDSSTVSKTETESKTRKMDLPNIRRHGASSKAQMVHNSHGMSEMEMWSLTVPTHYSWPDQSYPVMVQQAKPCYPSSQSVYNITTNCFEELPVYQYQDVSHQHWVMDDLESNNVMFQLLVSKKSHQRLAAEILASSRLNPNAKEFTPKSVIEKTRKESEDVMCQLDGHNELQEDGENQGEDPTEQDYVCDITIIEEDQPRLGYSEDEEESEEEERYEEEDEEDDWDWDSDEQSNGECVIIDPADFEDLFTPSLLMTNLSNCQCHQKPEANTNPKLKEVNRRFLQTYPDVEDNDSEITSKIVKFSNDPTIILEPENLAEELQMARIGEFAARQADRERMERLIGPILTKTHRQNVYYKIYGECL